MKWFALRRLARTVLFAYLMLSGAFFAFALTPDPNEAVAGYAAATSAMESGGDATEAAREAQQAYREARNRDRPLAERYWDWVSGYATFDWGYSYERDALVTEILGDTVPVTLLYVAPAILLSTLLSALAGVYASISRGGVVDRFGRFASAVGVGVPTIVVATLLAELHRSGALSVPMYRESLGPADPHNLVALAVPAVLVAGSLAAVQWRMVRTESLALLGDPFVKTLRASGADDRRLGRHVLRNAAPPLLALFTAEALVVLLLTIYVVETVLGIPGVGWLTLRAFEDRDIGLVLATVMLPVFVGLAVNFCKDVLLAVADPRITVD